MKHTFPHGQTVLSVTVKGLTSIVLFCIGFLFCLKCCELSEKQVQLLPNLKVIYKMHSNDQLTLFFHHMLFCYLSYINVSQETEHIHNTHTCAYTQTHICIYISCEEIKQIK
jgi:hypothetical protein